MNEQRSPFDGKMLIAIVAVALLWFGWQTYLQKKYPEHFKRQAEVTTEGAKSETADKAGQTAPSATMPTSQTAKSAVPATESASAERFAKYSDESWSFSISSKGMAIKDIQIKKYTDREDNPVVFTGVENTGNFSTNIVGRAQPLDFVITQPESNKFVGVAQLGNNKIVKTILVNSSNYTFKNHVRVESFDENFSGLVTKVGQHVKYTGRGSFLAPSFDHYELYVAHEGTYERHVFDVSKTFSQNFVKPDVVSVASQYFGVALLDSSESRPEVKVTLTPKSKDEDGDYIDANAEATLSYLAPGGAKALSINYTAFAGPKSFELLKGIDDQLANVVNFGFFQTIGKLIFKLMHAIHAVTGNWGLAIILLTILVRILVLPFNLMSYRSMKGMTQIQPQIKLLRERYKDDKVKQNEEMLKLMKEAKANPLGGCLPMFLQIPVFFALYQVLGQSIELYKAPFGLWIHDLSIKDPYFILPVLMGITLYFQQKITPNTLEPAQQKMMMILPFLFSFMMMSLPSGLTLYIFISGLFGVLQQLYFMKDDLRRTLKQNANAKA